MRCAANLCSANRKSAAYYFHRLRKIIAYELKLAKQEVFAGEIEEDESYFAASVKVSADAGGRRNPSRPFRSAGLSRGGVIDIRFPSIRIVYADLNEIMQAYTRAFPD